MTTWQSLESSAQLAERAGKLGAARFWREMAKDALALETHFPGGGNLYSHWAKDIAVRATQLSRDAEQPNKRSATN